MLKSHRVLATKLGVLAALGGLTLFIDPDGRNMIWGLIVLVAFVLLTGLDFAASIHAGHKSERSLSELIREARDQDSPPR